MKPNVKANNVVMVPAKIDGRFFDYWFEFLKPFHGLSKKEITIISAFVKRRYELSKVIKDDNILDSVVFNSESKIAIAKECNIKYSHLKVILSQLRKNGIIVNDKINRKFIPNIREGEDSFQLLIYFDMS